jgi:hypothetical protein
VIDRAKLARLDWLEAMAAVSHSRLTEHERETAQEIDLDNIELQEYLG